MAVCPVCQTSLDETIAQPAPVNVPTVAPAFDLASALAAIQQLTAGYNMLTGQMANHNKTNPQNKKPPQKAKQGRFVEQKQHRVTTTQKVYSKGDPAAFVTFQQINAMTFTDSVTGEMWVWQR